MNRLSTIIEYALLGSDHVVIPGLGTFTARTEHARHEEDEEVFLPPYRSVHFQTEEKKNDETAIDAMRTLMSITHDEAVRELREWVGEALETLEDEGTLELGLVGSLTKQKRLGAELSFEARPGGIKAPAYFGLDMVHIPQLLTERKPKETPKTASMEMGDKEITIHINRRIANMIAAACAAILLFVAFNAPVLNGGKEIKSSLRELIMPAKESTKQVVKTVEPNQQQKAETPKPKAKAETAVENQEQMPTQPTNISSNATRESNRLSTEKVGEYCIVMASAISLKNAERYVEKLAKQGFMSARIVDNGKVRRVVVGHYPTADEANSDARSIRLRSDEFSNVWVHLI